jgi:type IV secretion system protein VirB9
MIALAAPGDESPERFFAANPALTKQELQGLKIANQWRADSAQGVKPTRGADGAVSFLYGDVQPSIVCAVLNVCDIALQPGEVISNYHIGDASRWNVEPARSGSPEGEIQHVVIKPLDVGLRTSLMITTDRRTYYLQLVSHRSQYYPRITFTYPDQPIAKWKAFYQESQLRSDERQAARGLTQSDSAPLATGGDGYTIDGKAAWTPTRVWHDAEHTYLDMPQRFAQGEAPVLLALRGEDSLLPWGTKAEEVMVNYRLQGSRYIVDSVPDRLLLITGAGDHATRVVVTRQEAQP